MESDFGGSHVAAQLFGTREDFGGGATVSQVIPPPPLGQLPQLTPQKNVGQAITIGRAVITIWEVIGVFINTEYSPSPIRDRRMGEGREGG